MGRGAAAEAAESEGVWVTQVEALKRLAMSQQSLKRLVARGLVTCLHIPPARPKYCARSIEELLHRHTTPGRGA